MAAAAFLDWLVEAGVGPATVALPMNWVAGVVAGSARRWWAGFRGRDDLSRLLTAAGGKSFDLDDDEFDGIRRLLADDTMWQVVRRGTVGDVAARVATCIPPRDGRSKEQSVAAAEAIARGVLEFAVAELEPRMFQRVVLARLDRLQTGLASQFERALGEMHADLYTESVDLLRANEDLLGQLLDAEADVETRLDVLDKLGRQHYRSIVEHLGSVAQRLPPRPAGRRQVRIYLERLVATLDREVWLTQWVGGPTLSPSAIERTLRLKGTAPSAEEAWADQVAQSCVRLVILGGPGAGKTWLAKRIVRRSAQRALSALDEWADLDEIEVPVYATCSDLLGQDGHIGAAVAGAAVRRMEYLGPERLVGAIRAFLANRDDPMVVVIDSVDEAGKEGRRRFAGLDTVRARVVITSRPSAWNDQITIRSGDASHLVAELQRLSYPDDINPFIEDWFARGDRDPALARRLITQIRDRPDLQRAASVPLILTFFCILGGDEPLPKFRRDLYDRLVIRLLKGYWRDRYPTDPDDIDVGPLVAQLREWAWDTAHKDPHSGLGNWLENFDVVPSDVSTSARESLDHIASPTGDRNDNRGTIQRQFIHRSLQEHLVASYLADSNHFTLTEITEQLLPHLWYDPDWEDVAPAVVATRRDRSALLRLLLRRAARSQVLPSDLSVIDGGGEIHRFLGRLATHSNPTDWADDAAQLIDQARSELAITGQLALLTATAHWTTSNSAVRAHLFDRLVATKEGWVANRLIAALAQLEPTLQEKAVARGVLVDRFASTSDGWVAERLVQLDPTPQERATVRTALVDRLRTTTYRQTTENLVAGLVQLSTEPEDKAAVRAVLVNQLAIATDGWRAKSLVAGLVQVDPTPHDRAAAQSALLDHLATTTEEDAQKLVEGFVQLATQPDEKAAAQAALLDRVTTSATAWRLVSGLVQLATEPEDKAAARAALVDRLSTTDRWLAEKLVVGLAQLDPTPQDRAVMRAALIHQLTTTTDGWLAERLVPRLLQLDPTPQDKTAARAALIHQLTATTHEVAARLTVGLVQLDPTPQDKTAARAALVDRLPTSGWVAGHLMDGLVQLATDSENKAAVRTALIDQLATTTDRWGSARIGERLVQVSTTPQDKAAARAALIDRLPSATDGWSAGGLVEGLVQLDPTPQDKAEARAALVDRLPTSGWVAGLLVERLLQLATDSENKAAVRTALFEQLTTATGGLVTRLVSGLALLEPTQQEKAELRAALVDRLATTTDSWLAHTLVMGLLQFDPTPRDKAAVRAALVHLLTTITDVWTTDRLLAGLLQLATEPDDLLAVRAVLLNRLTTATTDWVAIRLVGCLLQLDPTPQDHAAAREALVNRLTTATTGGEAKHLVAGLLQLTTDPDDKAAVRAALVDRLTSATTDWLAETLLEGLTQLGPTPQDNAAARATLVNRLAAPSDGLAGRLIARLVHLAPEPQDRAAVRNALVDRLATTTDGRVAENLMAGLAQLEPTTRNLLETQFWAVTPSPDLLRAARRNVCVDDWLEALPPLAWLSHEPIATS